MAGETPAKKKEDAPTEKLDRPAGPGAAPEPPPPHAEPLVRAGKQQYRVEGEMIGHALNRAASPEHPVDVSGGLRKGQVVTVDDLPHPEQLGRYIRLGVLVPVHPLSDGRFLDIPSADLVGPHAVQE